LAQAAREFGIVRIRNHGADVQTARQAAHALFRLPAQLKGCPNCSVRNESVGLQRGYIPFAAESGLADVLEVKEGFSYGMDWPMELKSVHPFQTANPWPPPEGLAKLGPTWRSSMMGFFNDTIRVASTVVSSLAEALGDDGPGLVKLCQGGETISQMRVFHYLPPPPAAQHRRCMGSSPHTDWHAVTIISRDQHSSLQYLGRSTGQWAEVTATDDELLLLVGDWLSIFSGGSFHSPPHRVQLPGSGDSLSFVLFFYPSPEAMLPKGNTLHGRTGEELNTVDQSIFELSWGDYVMHKWMKVMSNR